MRTNVISMYECTFLVCMHVYVVGVRQSQVNFSYVADIGNKKLDKTQLGAVVHIQSATPLASRVLETALSFSRMRYEKFIGRAESFFHWHRSLFLAFSVRACYRKSANEQIFRSAIILCFSNKCFFRSKLSFILCFETSLNLFSAKCNSKQSQFQWIRVVFSSINSNWTHLRTINASFKQKNDNSSILCCVVCLKESCCAVLRKESI